MFTQISKATRPNFTVFFVSVTSVVAQSSFDGTAISHNTSGFVDDVVFSHNGANGPESKMMRTFRPVRIVWLFV